MKQINYLIKTIIITLSILPVFAQNITFVRHPIDLNFDGIHQIKMIDLDKDGDLDIVGGSEITPTTASKGLAWWRNEGNNIWTRFKIDSTFIHVMSVDTGDINNDSFTDIVASSWYLNQIVWLKNSGDPTQGWTRYIIKSGLTNAHDVGCADMDNDMDMDVVGAVSTPGSIQFCENNGSLSNWPITAITNSFSGALALFIADMDNDNNLDIIATASNANQVAWWKNNGGNPNTWPKKIIATNFVGASGLDVVHMNNDSLPDVVSNAWKSSQVAYWICDDIQNNYWTKYTVSTALDTPAGVKCSDLDKDNDMDIVAVGKIPGALVIYYQNSDTTWNEVSLENNFFGGSDIEIADLDNDGDDDIIACASYIGELYWWENTLITNINESYIDTNIPKKILIKNYPNPFNQSTWISYYLPQNENIVIDVYDISGRKVTTILNKYKNKGNHEIIWTADKVPSGLYFLKLKSKETSLIHKALIIK